MAGSAAGTFSVDITLTGSAATSSNGVCVSETLTQENGAVVRVACDSGQFVSISPIPGARFVGTHGGAYAQYFSSSFRGLNVTGLGEFAHGAGTVAAFRVLDVLEAGDGEVGEGPTQARGRLDLLVSF